MSSVQDNSIIPHKSCSLTCILNSTRVIIKPAQEHKYSKRTVQIHNNKTQNGQSKDDMAVAEKKSNISGILGQNPKPRKNISILIKNSAYYGRICFDAVKCFLKVSQYAMLAVATHLHVFLTSDSKHVGLSDLIMILTISLTHGVRKGLR